MRIRRLFIPWPCPLSYLWRAVVDVENGDHQGGCGRELGWRCVGDSDEEAELGLFLAIQASTQEHQLARAGQVEEAGRGGVERGHGEDHLSVGVHVGVRRVDLRNHLACGRTGRI